MSSCGEQRRLFRQLHKQRGGEGFDEMAVLPKECCDVLKDRADPVFLLGLTNQHAAFGEVIGNGLILVLAWEKARRD